MRVRGVRFGQPPRGLDAVELRHGHVHHHHVGLQALGEFDGVPAIGGFSDDLHVGLRGQDGSKSLADDRVIIRQQDADLFRHCSPRLASARGPRR